MPSTLSCTGCRAPIAVPKDYADPTIRCGICWTEVTLVAKPAPSAALPVAQALPPKSVARPVAQLLSPPPLPRANPRSAVVATPAKAAAGMGKLEALIQKAGAKLAATPPVAAPSPPPVVAVVPPRPPAVVPLAKPPLDAEVVVPPTPSPPPPPAKPSRIKVIEKTMLPGLVPPPAADAPVPIPQAPVPTPERVPSSQPVIEIQPIPTAAAPPVVVPVALNAVPVVAPVPIPSEPVPVPVPVPVTPVSPPTTPGGAPIVAGEFADDAPRSSARSREKDRPYKRRDDRREDDDEDDDDRRRPRRGETNNGAMIGMIVGGIVLFVGLCLGGYYVAKALRGNKTDPAPMAVGPNNNGPDPGPPPVQIPFDPPVANPNPPGFPNFPAFPNVVPPPPNLPGFQAKFEWAEHAGDGFKAKVVARPTEFPSLVQLHDPTVLIAHGRGKHVRAATAPPAATTEVVTADVPQGVTPDLKKIVVHPFGNVNAVTACKVADKDGWESVEQRGAMVVTARLVQVGCRVFVFKFTAWDAFGDKDEIAAAKKTFFDSIAITFDPTTPAPVDPAARPRNNRLGGPRADVNPPPGGPDPPADRRFPGQDALKLAVRIDPFLAAVTFPDRGEAFTVGLRGNKAGIAGELRRYEYPGFKLKNTYFLPFAGTFAVGSDKTNRLAITTMAKVDGYADGERSIVAGDVQVFDLKPIFDEKVAQREELKPLATIGQPTGTRLAGLEVSPDGTTAYYLTLGRAAKGNKVAFRVHRADLAAGKANGFVELPDAAWRLRLSADGAKLYAAEVPLNAAGNIHALPNRATNLVTIDVERWQLERTDQLAAGTALDFVPTGDALVASALGANAYSLWAVKAGPAVALDTPGEPPTSLGYVARTPDGKRLITSSAGRFSGDLVEVYDVTDWKAPTGFKKVASARQAKLIDQPGEAGVKVGHNFEVTPDGKYALFCESGAVVDLGAIKTR